MNPSSYALIGLCVVVFVLLYQNRRSKIIIARKIIEKRKKGYSAEMKELATRFIDKECIIYAFNGYQCVGVIKEVKDGAILVEKNENLDAINLDFVVRIREYPKNKKGKKKSLVLD